jgi:hypothetical protein
MFLDLLRFSSNSRLNANHRRKPSAGHLLPVTTNCCYDPRSAEQVGIGCGPKQEPLRCLPGLGAEQRQLARLAMGCGANCRQRTSRNVPPEEAIQWLFAHGSKASTFRLFSYSWRTLSNALYDASWLEPRCWCRLAWDTLRSAGHSRQPTGIHSANLREYPVDGLDCRPSASSGQALRGNDRRLDRDAIPNDIDTRRRNYLKKPAVR